MDKSLIRQNFLPQLDNPIFVEGLPGFGNVGKIAAGLLIRFSGAKLFAEYYSPFFPDYVVVNRKGICRPPRYELYAPINGGKASVIILTGNSQPPLDDVLAHYNICEEILDFAQKLGCRSVITIGGVPVSTSRKDVYVAATSSQLAAEVMGKGAILYGKGRIIGATGLFLGLAKQRSLRGICLLGATSGLQTDKDAGFAVFKLLMKYLGKEDQTSKWKDEKKG